MKTLVLLATLSAFALTACDDPYRDAQQAQQDPQQAPVAQQDDDHTDALVAGVAGAAAGYMLGKSSKPKTVTKRVIVAPRQPVVRYKAPTPVYRAPAPAYKSPSSPAPSRSYRPSFSSRRR